MQKQRRRSAAACPEINSESESDLNTLLVNRHNDNSSPEAETGRISGIPLLPKYEISSL